MNNASLITSTSLLSATVDSKSDTFVVNSVRLELIVGIKPILVFCESFM